VFLGETFTRKEQLAGFIALMGVVIIAHPASIFGKPAEAGLVSVLMDEVSPTQRLIAIAVAMIGIFGGSGAYTTIRVIGMRAHPLVSVNYFAFLTTVASAGCLLLLPNMAFKMPANSHEWVLLISLGILGFFLQFLLSAGLQLDRSSKATSMMYTQILFATMFDWAIWGKLPGFWSLIGGGIVIVSTLWVALQKTQKQATPKGNEATVDEESALLGAQIEGVEEVGDRRGSSS
jgi:drug/metabolite transporter (DMT)-like permease